MVRIKFNDMQIETDTAAEAAEVVAKLRGIPAAPRANTPVEATPPAPAIRRQRRTPPDADGDLPERSAELLQILVEAGAAGVASDELAERLELSSARGLSGVTQPIYKRLEALGDEDPRQTLRCLRSHRGPSVWTVDAAKLVRVGIISAQEGGGMSADGEV